MSSPLVRIPDEALLYEAVLQIKENAISHLAVEDRTGRIVGMFSNEDLLEVQRNSISYLIKEVSAAETIESLKKIHNKIPVLVKILIGEWFQGPEYNLPDQYSNGCHYTPPYRICH